MEVVIPYNFDPGQRPYQLQALRHPARFKFLKIHRKAGKTALGLNKLQLKCLKKKGIAWYVAPTYSQGKEIVWRDPEMIPKYVPEEVLVKRNESELTLTYITGSVLGVKGADKPDSLRGPNPMIALLDECFLMKKEIWTEVLLPIAMANPEMEIWILGTPKPMGRFWHELYLEFERRQAAGDPNYLAMTLSADDSGILTPEALKEAKSTMTQAAYEQEFGCAFHGEDGVVFRGLDRCIFHREERENPPERGLRYRFGIDLARVTDWTVLAGINRVNFTLDYLDRFNQVDYQLQKARIEAALRRYNDAEANVDATGLGDPIVEDLIKRDLNVQGVTITASLKANLITNLALMIEQGKIRIPDCYPEVIEELRIFGYEITKAGRTRYGAPEGRHDDCVIALALAVWEIGTRLSRRNLADVDALSGRGKKPSFL